MAATKDTATAGKDKKSVAKVKKPRKSPAKLFREVVSELKKVVWPTRQELINYTILVLVFVVLMTVLIWIMDTPLAWLFQKFIVG